MVEYASPKLYRHIIPPLFLWYKDSEIVPLLRAEISMYLPLNLLPPPQNNEAKMIFWKLSSNVLFHKEYLGYTDYTTDLTVNHFHVGTVLYLSI